MIAIGSEVTLLFVFDSSHKFVLFPEEKLRTMEDTLVMQEITIATNSVLVERYYLQHEGSDWNGKNCLRYDECFTPETVNLSDTIDLSYGWSMGMEGEDFEIDGIDNVGAIWD